MMDSVRRSLVNHVLSQLGSALLTGGDVDLTPFLKRLQGGDVRNPDIFESITGTKTEADRSVSARLSEIELDTFPQTNWLTNPSSLPDPGTNFALWSAIIDAETRNVIGARGEKGVPLATEFKLLSAMCHASGGDPTRLNDGFTLIGGDFPGVQRIIYTIASDGATKGVRGRSFFLQLLAECVVRRVLSELDLPLTNALYIAGGRFLLLAAANTDVSVLHSQINARLLEWFEGDLSLVLASTPLPVDALSDARAFRKCLDELHKREQQQKLQPFVNQFSDDFFDAQGIGSEYHCAISRREPRTASEVSEARTARDLQQVWISPEQRAFRLLAEDLARSEHGYLMFSPVYSTHPTRHIQQESDYAYLLHDITGWSARIFAEEYDAFAGGGSPIEMIRLNSTDFDLRYMHGFRFLAAHTPHITETDVVYLREHPDTEDPNPRIGETIRTFELLATRGESQNAFARLGVLRMDVDGLGRVFTERLQGATLTRHMALSRALSDFFEAYLPRICKLVEDEQQRPNSLYLLYGGGDDLFIVGEWEMMPILAQQVHDLFAGYSRGKLTISAGIELVPVKFPFYVAAERARQALDEYAKNYNPRGEKHPRKNAIALFGQVFGWQQGEEWDTLNDLRARLKRVLSDYDDQEKKTVIRNVTRVYDRWRKDFVSDGDRYLKYGPFCWMAAYQFTRIRQGVKADNPLKSQIQQDIHVIQQVILQDITLGGTAARWVEYELRS